MLGKLLQTQKDGAALVLRLGLGIVMFPHGAQKVLGWFGGYGFSGTMGFFTQQMHIPYALALLAVAAESLGALGLILDCLTRVAAFGVFCNMAVAMLMVHVHNGFFMNWFSLQQEGQCLGEGYEYHLLAIAICVALMIRGGGALSVDSALCKG